MTTHLVTFSSPDMERSMRLCCNSAYEYGVDHTWPWFQATLKRLAFYEENKVLLDNPKGAGLWAWKPFIIGYHLRQLINDSYLIYSDAGIEFIAPASRIIERMDHDIFLFGNNWEHAHWCKRDVIDAICSQPNDHVWLNPTSGKCPDCPWCNFSKQVQASVIFFRVSDYSRQFVAEWLQWCLFEGGRLIDDSPSRAPNHPEFREHRHDQAILTTMAYREGLKFHWWPAVYNKGGSPEFVYEKLSEYAGDDYPVLFSHHRRRDHEWPRIG